jgi:dUTPase
MNKKPIFKFALREDLKNDKQFLPTRAEPKASGWDVRAAMPDKKTLVIKPGDYFKIPLGFRAFPESGWWFQLHPRSSSFAKKYMHNLIGIIDEHYSNEVIFAGQYLPKLSYTIMPSETINYNDLIVNFGDAIGQIVPIKRIEMSVIELTNKEYDDLCGQRVAVRNGGFGSTDKSK